MNLLFLLLRTSPGMVVLAAFAGLLSGACSAGFIALINTALNKAETWTPTLVWSFVGLGLAKLVTNIVSQILLTRFSQQTIAALRMNLSHKILAAPLRHLEEIGVSRLLVTLTDDVQVISHALLSIPGLAGNLAILVGCSVYLGWLSWIAFPAMLGFIMLGVLSYRLLMVRALRSLKLAREEQDRLFSHFRALTEGIKELKLHRNRRTAFLSEHLQSTTEAFQHHNVVAITRFIVADSWSQLLLYALIGLLLFALPTLKEISTSILTGYVLTALYLMGPLGAIMKILPVFGRANVALQKVEELGLSLAVLSTEECSTGQPEKGVCWERLELVGVTHTYQREQEDSRFILGPIDLTFRPGELVFLVGGNGSGKSTLAKIVSGLYPPETGETRLDGKSITDANRDEYRQLFSVVFPDFYLFESLLGLSLPNLDARAQDYLVQLQLDHKVKIKHGVLSTTALSQGQRKRLALLTAYLEGRPFYVFDEWASDQDPLFKEIFYTKLLPELKARGKTVLVISHDDRYFHIADRCIKMEEGRFQHGMREPWEHRG